MDKKGRRNHLHLTRAAIESTIILLRGNLNSKLRRSKTVSQLNVLIILLFQLGNRSQEEETSKIIKISVRPLTS